MLFGVGLLSHELIRVWQRYMSKEKQLLYNDSQLLSFHEANHNTTSERGFCFVLGRIPQQNAENDLDSQT